MTERSSSDTIRKLLAISNPTRLEIYSSLWLDGPADALRLGQRLNMEELSVYYHLRKLEGAGLLRRRKDRGRTKGLYEAGERFSVNALDLTAPANRNAMIRFVEAILRAVAREYPRAVASLGTEVHDRTYVARTAIRLTAADQAELFARLRDLSSWMDSRRDPDGERLAVTVAVTPVT